MEKESSDMVVFVGDVEEDSEKRDNVVQYDNHDGPLKGTLV